MKNKERISGNWTAARNVNVMRIRDVTVVDVIRPRDRSVNDKGAWTQLSEVNFGA